MGTLVKFPKKRNGPVKRRLEDFLVERLPDHENHVSGGDLRFTCASCGHTASFGFKGLVFRECCFFCAQCGTGYRVDNPLFSSKIKSRSK